MSAQGEKAKAVETYVISMDVTTSHASDASTSTLDSEDSWFHDRAKRQRQWTHVISVDVTAPHASDALASTSDYKDSWYHLRQSLKTSMDVIPAHVRREKK